MAHSGRKRTRVLDIMDDNVMTKKQSRDQQFEWSDSPALAPVSGNSSPESFTVPVDTEKSKRSVYSDIPMILSAERDSPSLDHMSQFDHCVTTSPPVKSVRRLGVRRPEPRKVSLTLGSTLLDSYNDDDDDTVPPKIVVPKSSMSSLTRVVTQSSTSSPCDNVSVTSKTSVASTVCTTAKTPNSSSKSYTLLCVITLVLLVTNFCLYGMYTQTLLASSQVMNEAQYGVVDFEEKVSNAVEVYTPEVNVTKEEWDLVQSAWQQAIDEIEDLEIEMDNLRAVFDERILSTREGERAAFYERLSALESSGLLQCADDNGMDCADWAGQGECENNPAFMTWHCRRSCSFCQSSDPSTHEL